jgi:hypothetical protein
MAGQIWAVGSLGGYYASFNLSKQLRMGVQAKSKWRQFCDIKDAWGKVNKTGDTFTWDTVPMMTRASRALTETNTMGQGQHTIIQGTLTVSERGHSVPYTGKLEALAMFTVRDPIMKVLKYDAMVDLECLAHQQFNATPFTDTGDAWDGSAGDWVFFCGEDTVAEAIETPMEIRAKVPDDYGRSKGVAWYFLGGYGLAHGFGGANSAQARILKYDSAV